jgi:hypothetical protein
MLSSSVPDIILHITNLPGGEHECGKAARITPKQFERSHTFIAVKDQVK